jgi:hypothetical protein
MMTGYTRDTASAGQPADLAERSWIELIDEGLPTQLAELGRVVGQRNGRPIRVVSMPMLEAGMTGLAVPFEGEDAIVLDPRLLEYRRHLSGVVARELARTVYPGWNDLPPDQEDEIEAFTSVLTPLLLTRRPRRAREVEPLVELALELVEAA